MIIDSKKYSGKCACGNEHKMTTELCVIESGCLAKAGTYISQYGMSGFCAAIYDENTYKATAGVHPTADLEIILPAENLHADNHGIELAMEKLPEKCDYLIAVGAGTVHDITRYCAHKKGIPFVSCPTAASVDGFCSSVVVVTWNGFKNTFTAVAPKIVIADLDIISKAPSFLTSSGFGDMIGKYIALADWRIANLLTNEFFCTEIHDMTLSATKAVTESAAEIKGGSVKAFEKLTYGLLLSGLAMQLLGNSRCASGAEHHISHFIEMEPCGLGVSSNALHGEKVGVGTLLVCREYHRIKNEKVLFSMDYSEAGADYIREMFGEKLSSSVLSENSKDCASGITANDINKNIDKICDIINSIPTYDSLYEKYRLLGAKSSLSDIGVPEDKLDMLLEYSPIVRNRLTLMRLRRGMMR